MYGARVILGVAVAMALVIAAVPRPAQPSPATRKEPGSHHRVQKPAQPKPWAADVRETRDERACLRWHESRGQRHPYQVRNLAGVAAFGAYQYKDGTWLVVLHRARAFYHNYISRARRASLAPPWVQDVVTAFAVAHPDLAGGHPWPYCYY